MVIVRPNTIESAKDIEMNYSRACSCIMMNPLPTTLSLTPIVQKFSKASSNVPRATTMLNPYLVLEVIELFAGESENGLYRG